jgi:hypothetical protein
MRRLTAARWPASPATAERDQFAAALDVETLHAHLECAAHFIAPLTDAGEHHLGRVATRRQHAFKFTHGDDVEAATRLGKGLQDRQRRVGLHCIANQVLAADQRVLVGGQRGEHCGARIGVQGRAVLARQGVEAQLFDVEPIAAPGDVGCAGQRVHRETAGAEAVPAAAGRVRGPFWPQPHNSVDSATAASPSDPFRQSGDGAVATLVAHRSNFMPKILCKPRP